jgi:hypothetical protein
MTCSNPPTPYYRNEKISRISPFCRDVRRERLRGSWCGEGEGLPFEDPDELFQPEECCWVDGVESVVSGELLRLSGEDPVVSSEQMLASRKEATLG